MAADNWKELLDDPEVQVIVRNAVHGPGWRMYCSDRDRLLFDDLESALWDRAVDIAAVFPDAFYPVGDPGRRGWYGYLWTALSNEVTHHFGRHNGPAGSAKREAYRSGIRSIEGGIEAQGDRFDASLTSHRATRDDPLTILLHREYLEDLVRRAEIRPADQVHSSETSPYCIEPMCLLAPDSDGRCRRHYKAHFVRWGRRDGTSEACLVEGCPNVVTSRGMCHTHYIAERKIRTAAGNLWHDDPLPPCIHPACDRPSKAKGLCGMHYAQTRESAGTPCTTDGCTTPAIAKGLCRKHYKAVRALTQAPCSIPGCTNPGRCRGLCDKHYTAANYRARKAKADAWP